MNICFVISYIGIGGVGSVFLNTLDALLEHNDISITIYFHSMPHEQIYTDWLHAHPNVKTAVYYPRAEFFEKLKDKYNFPLFQTARKIIFSAYKKYRNYIVTKQITKCKFDAVIDYVSGESYKQTKHIRRTRKITWAHCSVDFAQTHGLIKRMAHYDNIVLLSDDALNQFAKTCPQHTNKLVRIYNPINYHTIQNTAEKLPKYNGQYFLCVGRMDQDKDIPTIIKAFNTFWMRENRPDIKMVFIGDGNIYDDMKKLATKTDARDQFVFLGSIPQPYGYMRGASAHILSSFNEGFGLVLIEAMASGTLNISSNCPNGPHEVLMDGKAGLLFTPGNSDELANAMSDVYKNKVNVKELTQTATKSLQRFTPKTISQQIIKLIKTSNKGESL